MQSMHNKSMILVKMPVIISSGFVYFSEDERVVSFFLFLFFLKSTFSFLLFIYLFAVDFYLCIRLGVEFKFEQTKFKNSFEFNVFI